MKNIYPDRVTFRSLISHGATLASLCTPIQTLDLIFHARKQPGDFRVELVQS
jgi:hypothetical protein